jgi:hypothetical protein
MNISSAKLAYYEKHVSAWAQSGLTQKEYCITSNISYGSFKDWRSKLEKSRAPQPRFLETKVAANEKALSNALVLQISLGNGARIGISAQAPSEMVKQVLQFAGGLG